MDITPRKDVVASKPTTSAGFMHMFDGIHFKFPSYKHDHPPVINVNEVADEELTVGQKVADRVASTVGSWRFIIIQSCILLLWIVLNVVGWFYHWDPYPFILLNLALSFQAAYSAPFVMMSQNRQAEKDRLTAQNDFQTDCKGEEEIRFIMEHLDHQDTVLFQLVKRIEEQHTEIKEHLVRLDPTLAQKLGMDVVELSKESLEGGEIAGNS
nr:DUF1003 domain-containing protein [Ktedonobacteraceae bacterium]